MHGFLICCFFSTVGFPLSASHHQKVESAVFYPRYYIIFFIPVAKMQNNFLKFKIHFLIISWELSFRHAPSDFYTSKQRTDRVTNLWASVPSPHITPVPSTLSSFFPLTFSFKTTFFFFFFKPNQALLGGESLLFSCEKSIAITGGREKMKEHAQEGGRQTAIPVSLTLPDGCHLP